MKFWYRCLSLLSVGVLLLVVACASTIVDAIAINEGNQNIVVGNTVDLTVAFTFNDPVEDNIDANKGVEWTSSNTNFATVVNNTNTAADVSDATVTGVAAGTATITAKSDKNGKESSITVTVTAQ